MPEAKGATDVLSVHDDLAQPRGGGPGWRRGTGNDTAKPIEGLGGRCATVLGQTPVVVQVEVEPCAQDAGDPAQRADTRCCSEVSNDLFDDPVTAERRLRPLRVGKAGEILSEGSALGSTGSVTGFAYNVWEMRLPSASYE